ncbi:protein of unknown function [Tepidibacter aestuarii]|nr:protein of unknown function [Tepidibacter aestuarii]
MDKLGGDTFEIIGLTPKGKEIAKIKEYISSQN